MSINWQKYNEILTPFLKNPKVKLMKNFIQHGNTTTYDHAVLVSRLCYELDQKYQLQCNLPNLLTAAVLHDYYLYDWHTHGDKLHGFRHAEIATINAIKDFHVGPKTAKLIYGHMWPLNLLRFPTSREAWVLWLADKLAMFREMSGSKQ